MDERSNSGIKVLTTKGLIDFSELSVIDSVEIGDNYRKIASEWFYNGELVKRDVAVSALRPLESAAEQGALNG